MTAACPPACVDLAQRLADAAGACIRRRFRTPFAIDSKADSSLVTEADREAERAMLRLINAEQPEHGIEGEEFGAERLDADWIWRLDPIDGTNSFVSGSPMFGTLIALVHRGEAALGLLDQPILNERWLAHSDAPTTLNGEPARVRPCPDVASAIVFTSAPEYFEGETEAGFKRLSRRALCTRFGADCYAFGLLCSGHIDIAIEAGLDPHDYAALVPLLENAGGIVTDWQGRRLDLASPADIIAAGDPAVHRQAIEIVNG